MSHIVTTMASDDGEIVVRGLVEDDWADYRALRLEALREDPEAFSESLADEAALDEATWRARMRQVPRFVAERGGTVLGIASLGTHQIGDATDDDVIGQGEQAEVFGLWVVPKARGTGIANALVRAAAKIAQDEGRSHVIYWVSTENGRAVAFASGLGFRPTDARRPMRGSRRPDEEEIAMILPLGSDRGTLPGLD